MERTVEIKRACGVHCSSIHNKSLLSFPAIIFWDKTSYTFYLPKKPKKLQGINQEEKELSHINVYTSRDNMPILHVVYQILYGLVI